MTPGKFAGFPPVGWGARSLRVERPGDGSDAITDENLSRRVALPRQGPPYFGACLAYIARRTTTQRRQRPRSRKLRDKFDSVPYPKILFYNNDLTVAVQAV